jgi:hypothetical protein
MSLRVALRTGSIGAAAALDRRVLWAAVRFAVFTVRFAVFAGRFAVFAGRRAFLFGTFVLAMAPPNHERPC